MFKGKARAYTNIALIKYWGKKNEALILPMNNSLSLTLDAFYTETEVIFSDSYIADEFYLDDTLQDEKATKKVSQFLDLFRKEAGISLKASVISQNFVPTAAGLASSASGLAALAGAWIRRSFSFKICSTRVWFSLPKYFWWFRRMGKRS